MLDTFGGSQAPPCLGIATAGSADFKADSHDHFSFLNVLDAANNTLHILTWDSVDSSCFPVSVSLAPSIRASVAHEIQYHVPHLCGDGLVLSACRLVGGGERSFFSCVTKWFRRLLQL